MASCFLQLLMPKMLNFGTVTLEELQAPLEARFSMDVMDEGPVEAYAGFFDVEFLPRIDFSLL